MFDMKDEREDYISPPNHTSSTVFRPIDSGLGDMHWEAVRSRSCSKMAVISMKTSSDEENCNPNFVSRSIIWLSLSHVHELCHICNERKHANGTRLQSKVDGATVPTIEIILPVLCFGYKYGQHAR